MLYHLAPSDLQFLQNSIEDRFGDECDKTLEETFMELLYGGLMVDNMKNLSTVQENETFWIVSGNRRLYLYKRLEHYGLLSTVPAYVVMKDEEKFNAMKTTRNNGQKVAVRSDRLYPVRNKMADRLDRIYKQWKSAGRPRDGQLPVYNVSEERDGWTARDDGTEEQIDDDHYSDYCEDFDETSDEEEVQLEDRVDLIDDIDYSKPDQTTDDDDKDNAPTRSHDNTRGRRVGGRNFHSRGSRKKRPYPQYQGSGDRYSGSHYTEDERAGRVIYGRGRGPGRGRGRGRRRDGVNPVEARDSRTVNSFSSATNVPSLMRDVDTDKQFELPVTKIRGREQISELKTTNADFPLAFHSCMENMSWNSRESKTSVEEPIAFIRNQDYNSNMFTWVNTVTQNDDLKPSFTFYNHPVASTRSSFEINRRQGLINTSQQYALKTAASNSFDPQVSTALYTEPANIQIGQISTDIRATETSRTVHNRVQMNSDERETDLKGIVKNNEPMASQASGIQHKTQSSRKVANMTLLDLDEDGNTERKEVSRNTQSNVATTLYPEKPAGPTNLAMPARRDSLIRRPTSKYSDPVETIQLPKLNVSFAEFESGLDKATRSYIETYPSDQRFEIIQKMRTDNLYKTKIEKEATELMGQYSSDIQEMMLEQANILREIKLQSLKPDGLRTSSYTTSGYTRPTMGSQYISTNSSTSTTSATKSNERETQLKGILKNNSTSTIRAGPTQTPTNAGLFVNPTATSNLSNNLDQPPNNNNTEKSSSKCVIS